MGGIFAQRGGTGGATKALSNLANVAVIVNLLPDGDGTRNLGVPGSFWLDICGKNVVGPTVFNEAGADVDFRFEGVGEPNLLFLDAGAKRIGVGTQTPGAKMEISLSSSDQILQLRRTGSNPGTGYLYSNGNEVFGVNDGAGRYPFLIRQGAPSNSVVIDSSGKVDSVKDHQTFTAIINGSSTWQTVNYPTPFPAGSVVRVYAVPQDDNGTDFSVRVRSVGITSFQFRPRDHSGAVHTGSGVVGFLAIRSS